nr:hypothetical protein CFP56_31281 [Quercus suber]
MKAILIVCLLFASIFFIPSSNAAEGKCGRGIPYRRCISSPLLPPQSPPLKPPSPPLKPPPPPPPSPPHTKPPSGCSRAPYRRCAPPTP